MTHTNVKFEPWNDIIRSVSATLKSYGYQVPSFAALETQDRRDKKIKEAIKNYDIQNLLFHFFTVIKRRVDVKCWEVHYSHELKSRSDDSARSELIGKRLEAGIDINDLLSPRVRKMNQVSKENADLLLYEWGVHHLHFNSKGSKDLLFVYFRGRHAFLLDVMPHEDQFGTINTWTNTKLIQILHDNWPEAIEDKIFRSGGGEPDLSVEGRRTLRGKATNSLVTVSDGTSYLPIGGGFTPSRHPCEAILRTDMLVRQATTAIEMVAKHHNEIRKALNLTVNATLDLELVLNEYFRGCLKHRKTGLFIDVKEGA